MDIELEVYNILKKHKLRLRKREDLISDLLLLIEKYKSIEIDFSIPNKHNEKQITHLAD